MRTINGLNVSEHGNPDNPAVVFVHGFIYTQAMWTKMIEFLKDDYYCVAYDVRGLGASEVGDGQYTMESFVDDLYAVVEGTRLDRPVLCGLSMGGYLGFRALERDPKKFRAAAMLDTRAAADDNAAKLRRAAGIKQITEDGLGAFVDGFLPKCFSDRFKSEEEAEFRRHVDAAKAADPKGVKGCALAMQGRTDSTAFLATIDFPTLLLCGEHDALSPVEEMRAIAEEIPGAEFRVIPDSGHMTPIENPTATADRLREFLSTLSKG
jgi:3-oxoadipate enol-lactonase